MASVSEGFYAEDERPDQLRRAWYQGELVVIIPTAWWRHPGEHVKKLGHQVVGQLLGRADPPTAPRAFAARTSPTHRTQRQ